jgi:hypothetical protein
MLSGLNRPADARPLAQAALGIFTELGEGKYIKQLKEFLQSLPE